MRNRAGAKYPCAKKQKPRTGSSGGPVGQRSSRGDSSQPESASIGASIIRLPSLPTPGRSSLVRPSNAACDAATAAAKCSSWGVFDRSLGAASDPGFVAIQQRYYRYL